MRSQSHGLQLRCLHRRGCVYGGRAHSLRCSLVAPLAALAGFAGLRMREYRILNTEYHYTWEGLSQPMPDRAHDGLIRERVLPHFTRRTQFVNTSLLIILHVRTFVQKILSALIYTAIVYQSLIV